jgi:hypothetical protein
MQLRTHVVLAVLLALVVLLAGCPPKQPAATPTGTPSASTGPAPAAPEGAPAETPAATAEPASGAALTEDVVKRFMASMDDKKIDGIMDGIGKELGLKDKESPESIKKMLDKAAGSAELTEAVKAHGFKDAAEWTETLKRVLPGMSTAMEKVITDMMGPEAAKQPAGAAGEDEFAAMKKAFGEPSEADVAVIAKVVKEQMEAEQGGAAKSTP